MSRFRPRMAVVPAAALVAAMLPATAAAAAATAGPARHTAAHARVLAGEARPEHLKQHRARGGTAGPQAKPATLSSVPVGSGPVPNGTLLSFPISDKVQLRVNVGSGDALVTTSDITIPQIGSPLTLGASYNSLLAGSGAALGEMDAYGWRQREGADVQLYPNSDGSAYYIGEDGVAGKFQAPPSGGNVFGSPAQFHVKLTKVIDSSCSGSVYEMIWHQTGEKMCFTTGGILTKEIDRHGNTDAFTYNGSGLETQVAYTPQGASTATRTVTVNNSTYLSGFSWNGGTAGTKNVIYTPSATPGDLSSVQQADGTTVTFGYDSSHNLTSIKNGAGLITQLGYNSSHQVTSVTQQTTGTGTATTRFSYVSATETQVAAPNTNQSDPVSSVPNTTYTIQSQDDLVTKSVDPAGDTRSQHYSSSQDNVTSSTSATGGVTTDTWGSNNGESLTSVKTPSGATSTWAYGNAPTGSNPTAAYQPSSATDPQDQKSTYAYNGPGDLSSTTNALAEAAKVTYNTDGTPQNSTDPANGSNDTTYNYTDGNHELNKVTPVTGTSLQPETLIYDGFGRVATVTNGDSNTVTYTYDLADRVTKAAWTGGTHTVTVTYSYDGAGNLHIQTDASGTITYGYNGQNLATSRTATSGGGTLTYQYDGDQNLTQAQDAGGITTYTYNDLNQLASMTDPTSTLWEFAYNADGHRIKEWFDTNTSESVYAAKISTGYDPSGRIGMILDQENSASPATIASTSYCYSPYVSGQSCPAASAPTDTALLQYSTDSTTGTRSVYSYTNAEELKGATNISGTTYSYGYDHDGNLTTHTPTGGSLAYNAANQVTTGSRTYDGAGNLTASSGNPTMTYNDANQLISATTVNGAATLTYADDTQDQVLSDGSATHITYGLNGQGSVPWVQSYTPAASPTPVYVLHDQNGTPLGMIQGGNDYAFITDNHGSVTNLVTTTGTTAATYAYDPYGNQISSSGSLANTNLLRYTGALTDYAYPTGPSIPGTGYTHLGQRWQNPFTGSFTQQDTLNQIGDPANANRYAYAGSDPANNVDPTGRSCGSSLLDYAIPGGILTGTGESAIAASSALEAEETAEVALETTLAGGILGAAFGLGLVAVALVSC